MYGTITMGNFIDLNPIVCLHYFSLAVVFHASVLFHSFEIAIGLLAKTHGLSFVNPLHI